MARLEDIRAGVSMLGLAPEGAAKIVGVEWFGDQAIKVTYEDDGGAVDQTVVHRSNEGALRFMRVERRRESRQVARVVGEKGFGTEGDEPGGVQINRFLALGGEDDG